MIFSCLTQGHPISCWTVKQGFFLLNILEIKREEITDEMKFITWYFMWYIFWLFPPPSTSFCLHLLIILMSFSFSGIWAHYLLKTKYLMKLREGSDDNNNKSKIYIALCYQLCYLIWSSQRKVLWLETFPSRVEKGKQKNKGSNEWNNMITKQRKYW